MVELQSAFNDGSKSAGSIADELARSLPVLGGLYSAGRNIRELITGDEAALKRANEQLAAMKTIAQSLTNVFSAGHEGIVEMTRLIDDLRDKIALVGASPLTAGLMKARTDVSGEIDRINQKYQSDVGKINSNLPPNLAESLRTQLAKVTALQQQLAEETRSNEQTKAFDPEFSSGMLYDTATTKAKLADAQQQLSALQSLRSAADKEIAELTGKRTEALDEASRLLGKLTGEALVKNWLDPAAKSVLDWIGVTTQRTQAAAQEASVNVTKNLDDFFKPIEDRYARMNEAAKRVHESVATPMERFTQNVADLTTELDAGVLSQNDYTRAIQRAIESMAADGMGNATYSSRGAFNPAEIQSLQGSFTIPVMQQQSADIRELSRNVAEIVQKVRNGQLRASFD